MVGEPTIIAGVALAGLAAAGGVAFTAGGLSDGLPDGSGFIGGSVGQSAVGATLTDVAYSYGAGSNAGAVSGINLTFAAGADGMAVMVRLNGGTSVTPFTCERIDGITAHCTGSHTGEVTSVTVTVQEPT